MVVEDVSVTEHEDFEGGYRLLVMHAPGIAPDVQPGQFVHLRVPQLNDSVLRRPFSIFRADGDRLRILYKDVGRGTHAMRALVPGDTLNLIGPLGRPFPAPSPGKTPLLIAGGYGMAALYMTARSAPEPGVAFFGGRTSRDILCVNEFEALGWEVRVTTQDGSMGTEGIVTAALDPWLAEHEGTEPEFYCCGPNAMLAAIAERALARSWTAWVSVDRNMGCGVGACLTCVVKVRSEDGWTWARSCKEGPVFEAGEVLWEEMN